MSRAGILLLALLGLCSYVFGQETVEAHRGVLIFCDDPSVEKAVSSALQNFNEKIAIDHKLALFQILSASKSENGSDSVYSLQFTSRRSNCSAQSNQPWTDCDYLPTGHAAPISCNATVHVTETASETKQVYCMIDGFVSAEKAPCLGCPEEIDEGSEDLKVPISASVSKYNLNSNSLHLFALNEMGHATRQVVAGFRFKLRFDMRRTVCGKAEHKDLNELCLVDEQNVEFAKCNATVDVAPWRLEQPEVQIDCEPGRLPQSGRRRPPGWSPLRTVSSRAPHLTPSPPPAAPAKQESSEEDTKLTKLPSSPGEKAHPFHCPSKPWKPFRPMNPQGATGPVEVNSTAASAQPGAFSDTDLLT